MAQLFSVVALFIMFREALEASVIIAVMLQMLTRLKLQKLRKQVWYGAFTGIGIAILLGIAFIITFYVAAKSVFQGEGKMIFTGFIQLLAAFLITVLAFAMLKFMNYEQKWERKLYQAATEKIESGKWRNYSVFLLAFSATLREGIESVIFLAGVTSSTSATAIPIPGIIGIILGLTVGVFLYYSGRQIKDLKWFFIVSTVFLLFIAAGLTSMAFTNWQAVGWFGSMADDCWDDYGYCDTSYSDRPWWNKHVWDTCGCCSESVNGNKFFFIMNALFGYQCAPTFISLISYFGFWLLVIAGFAYKHCKGSLFDANAKHKDIVPQEVAAELEAAARLKLEGGELPSQGSGASDIELGELKKPVTVHSTDGPPSCPSEDGSPPESVTDEPPHASKV